MEFVVVSEHDSIESCKNQRDMRILSIPEALLVYTGCKDKQEFGKGIVHITFAFDYISILQKHNYCSVNGSFVFKHSISSRTAVMSMVSEIILLPTGTMYRINKINNIMWQTDDEVCEFLGILEAKVRLGVVESTQVCRNDTPYYAVPSTYFLFADAVRQQLKFSRCEFSVAVSYKNKDGTRCNHRSLLLPTTLIDITPIAHDGLFSIVSMHPTLTYVYSPSSHKTEFGIDPTENRCDFDAFVAQYHTSDEMQRIRREIMPVMRAMEPGGIFEPNIKFVHNGSEKVYKVSIRNIGRSCFAVVFTSLESKDETPATLPPCNTDSPNFSCQMSSTCS